jgi:hypothetical protein
MLYCGVWTLEYIQHPKSETRKNYSGAKPWFKPNLVVTRITSHLLYYVQNDFFKHAHDGLYDISISSQDTS